MNFVLMSDGGCNNGYIENGYVFDKKSGIRLKSLGNYATEHDSYVSPLFEIIKSRSNVRISTYHLISSIEYIKHIEGLGAKINEFNSNGFVKIEDNFNVDNSYYVNSKKIFSGENSNEFFLMKSFIDAIT